MGWGFRTRELVDLAQRRECTLALPPAVPLGVQQLLEDECGLGDSDISLDVENQVDDVAGQHFALHEDHVFEIQLRQLLFVAFDLLPEEVLVQLGLQDHRLLVAGLGLFKDRVLHF